MSVASEYLPEHPKAFRIAPAGPDLGQLILNARDEVIEDNSLSIGARLMFVRILDLSVRQASNVAPGIVTISQTKLSETLGVSLRTIWGWKRELVRAGKVWMTVQPMPNAWPINTYHISAIHPPKSSSDKTTTEGLWGNGSRQRYPLNIGLGARARNASPPVAPSAATDCESQNIAGVSPKSSILPENATPHRKALPPSAAIDCGGEPQQVATGGRKILRRGAAIDCDGGPQNSAAGGRKILRRGTEADCEHKKAKVPGNSHFKVGEKASPPPPGEKSDAFIKWERTLDDMFPSHLRQLEKKIRGKLESAKAPEIIAGLKMQLKAVQERLLPTIKVPVEKRVEAPAGESEPVKVVKEKMPLAVAKALFEKSKKEAGIRA